MSMLFDPQFYLSIPSYRNSHLHVQIFNLSNSWFLKPIHISINDLFIKNLALNIPNSLSISCQDADENMISSSKVWIYLSFITCRLEEESLKHGIQGRKQCEKGLDGGKPRTVYHLDGTIAIVKPIWLPHWSCGFKLGLQLGKSHMVLVTQSFNLIVLCVFI